ncbi:MAG TPA: diaminopimelate epimerase [Bryobacteraceae bacterium]|jgi:diaminopimelate epimerase|nr:diaminopimelate epimerase [Bryobacteraceae bacterium]
MIRIPFTKLHGDENDFLLTWAKAAPVERQPHIARRICERHTGVGADGWMLFWVENGLLRTRLFNSDGSEPEMSGNGTRCAAAFALHTGVAAAPAITIATAAGHKHLKLISRTALRFEFQMDMGLPAVEELHAKLLLNGAEYDATILNVGNPQCAIFVKNLADTWRMAGAEAERHPRFPDRSNVSFVRVLDRHTIDVVFYERGAGETRSSGTGSTGAGAAAILRGEVDSPVEIRTPAGSLSLRWDETVLLTGPAEIIGEGTFFLEY